MSFERTVFRTFDMEPIYLKSGIRSQCRCSNDMSHRYVYRRSSVGSEIEMSY